jgi:hypothetical protein
MRDNYQAVLNQNAEVFGLGTQTTAYQTEAATRFHLPFALLSDEHLRLSRALRLPTFQVNGWTLTKRCRLVLHRQRIEKVFYPVFPPDKRGDLAIIDAEAPPLRFFVGSSGLPRVRDAYQARLGQWEQWAELSNSAQGQQKKVIISI